MVEGTPLLRAQAGNRLEGSNPFGSATFNMKNKLRVLLGPFFLMVSKGFREFDRPSETGKRSKTGL